MKDKQIEEMARELAYNVVWDEDELQTVDCLETAKRLYSAGYRKQSEGEWKNVTESRDGTCIGYCSRCGTDHKAHKLTDLKNTYRYCRCCGAMMKGGTE